MRIVAVLAVSMLLASGCALDRTGVGDEDGGPGIDAQSIDAGGRETGVDAPPPDDDSGIDSGRIGDDSGTDGGGDSDSGIDSGIDSGTDAGTDSGIDAGTDAGLDSGPPRMTCDMRYGGIRRYELCAETATSCEFYSDPSTDSSCNTICAAGGGTCISAHEEDSANCSDAGGTTCDTAFNDVVCVCTRP